MLQATKIGEVKEIFPKILISDHGPIASAQGMLQIVRETNKRIAADLRF